MFALAIFLGIFSYSIFFLGLLHLLYPSVLISLSIIGTALFFFFLKNRIKAITTKISLPKSTIGKLLLFFILVQAVINAIGALGPELGFDALWYHLTLPKLYLMHHAILHIPNTLFYYSDMPKLIEMLYIPLLAFGDVFPKLIHFSFGLAVCVAIFLIAKRFFTTTVALAAVLIFYSSLVVGWESISGYIDLGRTFFDILALWAFLCWAESQKWKWLMLSALMVGLTITAKLLGFGSLGIFLILIVLHNLSRRNIFFPVIKQLFVFIAISLIVPLPWFIFSLVHTGNPVYPFFSSAYPIAPGGNLSLFHMLSDVWNLFTTSADPVSPIYLAFFPIIILLFSKASSKLRLVYYYSFLALFVWYLTPRTGGGRFILPYLPAFSLLAAFPLQQAKGSLKTFLYGTIILVSLISIGYRSIANSKFIPVIIGKETKADFLATHLNFSFGDFYDIDGYFTKHILPSDTVLLLGFHNLFYVNFPFTLDLSGKNITYIAIQGKGDLPNEYKKWQEVYHNETTFVRVYHK